MTRSWLVAVLVLVMVGAPGAAADDTCSLAAVKATRRSATALMKQKKHSAAVKLLSAASCYVENDQAPALQLQTAWLVSDLAFAYFKAGQADACYSTAEGQLTPKFGSIMSFADQNAKLQPVVDALTHNSKVCYAAVEKARGAFLEAKACGDDGYAVPAELLPPRVKAQCVVMEPGLSEDPANEGLHSCGAVKLVSTPAKGKPVTTVLDVDGANLTEGSICCHRTYVGFRKRAGTWTILVKTAGRDCDGGTADSAEDEIYKLDGSRLTSEGGVAVSYH